jgi:cobalamin-dependent methionine synthase I
MSEREGAALALATEVRREEVLRFLGYPAGQRPAPRVEAALADALAAARSLVAARGVYRRFPAVSAPDAGLSLRRGDLPVAVLVLGLVTAGAELERRGAELARLGRTAEALLLDAAGSAAAEEAADRLCALVVGAAPEPGTSERLACRFSPGYGDWPLAAQRLLFDLLPCAEVGVELLPSMMMRPRKSVSFGMWLGPDGRPVPGLSGCGHCLLERCAFRIRSPR